MKPIPKSLLPHSVMLHKKVNAGGRFEEDSLDDGTKLTYVRMETSSRIVRDKNGAEIQLAATLFYDCRNSDPKDISFKVDDVIVFSGQNHRIQIVEPLYDRKKLHHYELGLVSYA